MFRPEALRRSTDRLHGRISVAIPVTWQVIGYFFFVSLSTLVAYLAVSDYPKIETIGGAIVLDQGVVTIVGPRNGLITATFVRDGSVVKEGQRLLAIRTTEYLRAGTSAADVARSALDERDRQITAEREMILAAAASDEARIASEMRGNEAEILNLRSQLSDQDRLVLEAQGDYEAAQRIAERGFVSKKDVSTRYAVLLSRRQQSSQLRQSIGEKKSEIMQLQSVAVQSRSLAQAQAANRQASRSEIRLQRSQMDVADESIIVTPVDGEVTALTARIGQRVDQGRPLAAIYPQGSVASAELYAPSSAAGLLHSGQVVRLAVDAFPFQTYGTVPAVIKSVARVAIQRQSEKGTESVFLVELELKRRWVMALGRRRPLLPGMAVTGRVQVQRRNLLQLLFEPLYSVGF